MIKATRHKVFYYETDAMKCVHHSNYIRWFEEARTDFFEQIGIPYSEVEKDGMCNPVLSVSCDYKLMCRYEETLYITTKLESFDGLKFEFSYKVIGADDGKVRVTGRSKHCFVSLESGRILNMKKIGGRYCEIMTETVGIESVPPDTV